MTTGNCELCEENLITFAIVVGDTRRYVCHTCNNTIKKKETALEKSACRQAKIALNNWFKVEQSVKRFYKRQGNLPFIEEG